MIGRLNKAHVGILATIVVAATLPAIAEDLAKSTSSECVAMVGLEPIAPISETHITSHLVNDGVRSRLVAECVAFPVLPKFGARTFGPLPGVGTTQSDFGAQVDQGDSHSTSASGRRFTRLLRHVSWSWGQQYPYGDPSQILGIPNRP